MSCACENKKKSSEYERMRRLAKAAAELHEKTVVLFMNEDGTYGFSIDLEINKLNVEYISPF